jgi:hypothetical protein
LSKLIPESQVPPFHSGPESPKKKKKKKSTSFLFIFINILLLFYIIKKSKLLSNLCQRQFILHFSSKKTKLPANQSILTVEFHSFLCTNTLPLFLVFLAPALTHKHSFFDSPRRRRREWTKPRGHREEHRHQMESPRSCTNSVK